MLDYDKALWRRRETLEASENLLDDAWTDLVAHRQAKGLDSVAARETAALAATARWCIAAASKRKETRGLHLRADATQMLPGGERRLLVGGLDDVWVRYEQEASVSFQAEAAA